MSGSTPGSRQGAATAVSRISAIVTAPLPESAPAVDTLNCVSEDAPVSRRLRALARVQEHKVRHRRRGRLYRIGFGVVGVVLIAVGLLLLALPGPGLLVIAIGIGMLALEFDRAERLLDRILARVERATEKAVTGPRRKAFTGLVAALALGAVVAAIALFELPLLPG